MKHVYLTGRMMFPLQVGLRALILHNGQCIPTRPVTQIQEERADLVRFETCDTRYCIAAHTPYPQGMQQHPNAQQPIRLCA